MKLYNFFRSGTSHRLRIALNLKGLPTTYVPVAQRTAQHLIAHPAQVQATANHDNAVQPGHFFEDQVKTEQCNACPHHHACGNAEHAHHRLFAGATDGSLRHKEEIRTRAHQGNNVHQGDGEKQY